MPVTFEVNPSKIPSESLSSTLKYRKDWSAERYIREACPNQTEKLEELLQASFGNEVRGTEGIGNDLARMKVIKRGGLVDVAAEAYSNHHHLVLRPDDIWIAILAQLSFYVNAHSEELRHTFVSHEGKKDLVVEAVGTRYSVNFALMAKTMCSLLKDNIKDPRLCEWIIADFSTTTDVDRTIYAVEMMATLKEYFTYTFYLRCGLPKVTLEGEKSDWEDLLVRIETLEAFGDEPAHWAKMLSSVLSRCVRSFEAFQGKKASEEEKAELRDFWNKIASHHGGGSGPTWLSGWITAFCPWSEKGVWMDRSCAPGTTPNPNKMERLVLDEQLFPVIDTKKVPSGLVEVDVKLDDNGEIFQTVMVAGHLGGKVQEGPTRKLKDEKLGLAAGWFMFIKNEDKPQK